VQHISDMHSKFTLRPHHVWKYGRHLISDGWDYARKKDRRRYKSQGKNILCLKKTSHLWLATTLTHMNRFWYFWQKCYQ